MSNRAKLATSKPTPAPQKRGSETVYPNPTSPPAIQVSKLRHAEVVANKQETRSSGGYTTSSDELSIGIERPQRN